MKTAEDVANEAAALNSASSSEDLNPLRCWDCNVNFTTRHYLHDHLFHHIKQPVVSLTRLQLPPLKLTLKNKSGNSFEIVNSPNNLDLNSPPCSDQSESTSNLAETEVENGENECQEEEQQEGNEDCTEYQEEEEASVNFSPNFAQVDLPETSPSESQERLEEGTLGEGSECGSIPGAEPTPPPEPSPELPKIRIKTTGLLKETCTITEISDDVEEIEDGAGHKDSWNNSMEDPLKLPTADDIMSLFNNNEKAKDFGFTTSDSEFIPLDRLGERNSNALQVYNHNSHNHMNQNPLNSLTGLPMEALAQQVSRLQPSSGMHQQNVLINIQQFPQAPPHPPPYHAPNMYHHPPQPMYHQSPYPSYPPPPMNPMFYPPASGYAQHMPPPPQPQMPMNAMGQPPSSQPQNMQGNQPFHRPPMNPRQQAPPRQMPPQRPMGPNMGQRAPMSNPRGAMPRQRAPMVRPRGVGVTAVRSMRPRMATPQNGVNGQIRQPMIKRTQEQIQAMQAKKKRLDVLTPDKDDEDCQVICMQPKNTDGGLPQISSVQGGTSEPSESSIMHLSDSITLSVRNPQPRPQSPKKSDAKAVANILATRGITVTATPKPKEKNDAQKGSAAIPAQLNLNSAVSIIPSAAKNGNKPANPPNKPESHLPTVDLTDDSSIASQSAKAAASPQKPPQSKGLPFKCDLCPAQYPNAIGLSKHRQNYHKTNSGMCEIGVPLINLKQPGIFQKLSSLGIYNYIPLPASGPDGTFALPIINGRNPGNVAALGATTMLTLGPVRHIPKPQTAVNGALNANRPQANIQNK